MKHTSIHTILWVGAALILTSCGMKAVKDSTPSDQLPDIYPDYIGVTIPTDIAPLNFCMNDSLVERIDVVIKGNKGGELHAQGTASTNLPMEEWKELLRANAGDSLSVTV
ncbi:MAG: hypothetical protein HUJ98_07425, partial [Bacteroidaceae bacterium]|nr:hypothetical protein [Bacteroidaceae bacterium]MCF0186300.1 hypothetical protein [Bacteroidaceae bacterium]